MEKSDLINLIGLAMKKVNVVPYGENEISFGTNEKQVDIKNTVTVCDCFINVANENQTVHIGFTANVSIATPLKLCLCVDGNDLNKIYSFSESTINFIDFIVLPMGLHHIAVKASSESSSVVLPREAKLGVFL